MQRYNELGRPRETFGSITRGFSVDQADAIGRDTAGPTDIPRAGGFRLPDAPSEHGPRNLGPRDRSYSV
ncbi:hypothetical protein NJ7G_1662 [Natrinema sp. J7-2]|nr:hypothetical protein NJ7G_1662 [Natrinema sp. J7-2]